MTDNNAILTDKFGRALNYLRVSVTDRCNHRCSYCTSGKEEYSQKARTDILSYDEIRRTVTLMAKLGITKVRLTGGEPLIRKDLDQLVTMIKDIGTIEDLTMTTNAALLKPMARKLKAAGLDRVNISLDTLREDRFKDIVGARGVVTATLKDVLDGIEAAIEADLTPIKLNAVIMRTINDDELGDIIDYASERGARLRFIECMPMSDSSEWKRLYMPMEEVLKLPQITSRVDTSAVAIKDRAAAYTLPLKNGNGTVGFVSPMSNRFCDSCNRLRLTSDGRLRACLPSDKDVDIRDALRTNATEAELTKLVREAVLMKPEVGEYNYDDDSRGRSMLQIGG